jgi:hypothetical protein
VLTEARSNGNSAVKPLYEWLLLLATILLTVLFGGAAVHPLSRCWLGDARACSDVSGENEAWAERRACALGKSFACARVGGRLLTSNETPQDSERGLALLLETCERARSSPEFGESVACHDASEYLRETLDLERESLVSRTCCDAHAVNPREFYFGSCCKSPEELKQAHAKKLNQTAEALQRRQQQETGCQKGERLDCLSLAEGLLHSVGRFQRKDAAARARAAAMLDELCREEAPKQAFVSSSACESLYRMPEQASARRELKRLACDRLQRSESWDKLSWQRLCKEVEDRP